MTANPNHESKKSKIIKIITDKHPCGVRTADIDRQIFPPRGSPRNMRGYNLIIELRDEGKIKPKPPYTGSPWILACEDQKGRRVGVRRGAFVQIMDNGMSMKIRKKLIKVALEWQEQYGVAPAITSAVSEFDAAMMVGMPESEYSKYMQNRTAVSNGHDFEFQGKKYQIKACRPSGKPGSKITKACNKFNNYKWDILIWIRYNTKYEMEEAWLWCVDEYKEKFGRKNGTSPKDMQGGKCLFSKI